MSGIVPDSERWLSTRPPSLSPLLRRAARQEPEDVQFAIPIPVPNTIVALIICKDLMTRYGPMVCRYRGTGRTASLVTADLRSALA